MAAAEENAAHCMATVRTADPDRYLSVLYAPKEKRAALYALYAFNIETARIRDLVSEPMPGEIRLQWWKDAVSGHGDVAAQEQFQEKLEPVFRSELRADKESGKDRVSEHGGTALGNPVVASLRAAMERWALPSAPLERLCEARIFDLYDDPMPDRTALEGYCGETASALIQLAALVLDSRAAGRAAEASGHAGVAQGIAGILRLLPLHRRRGQLYFPPEILAAAGIDGATLLRGKDKAGAARAVEAMAALAREHYASFVALARELDPVLRPSFLPALLTPAYLDRIQREGAGMLERTVTLSPLRRQWLMLRARL